MADDPADASLTETGPAPAICPWCSAVLPAPDAAVCPSCEARLVEEHEVEIPGVTSVEPSLIAAAAAPRKIKRTFGSLFVGEDNSIPPPSEAELPALAPPDADVRREMLRLELDARLAALQAEVKALESENGPVMAPPDEPPEPPSANLPPDEPAGDETGDSAPVDETGDEASPAT
jgi:hypothetical protein